MKTGIFAVLILLLGCNENEVAYVNSSDISVLEFLPTGTSRFDTTFGTISLRIPAGSGAGFTWAAQGDSIERVAVWFESVTSEPPDDVRVALNYRVTRLGQARHRFFKELPEVEYNMFHAAGALNIVLFDGFAVDGHLVDFQVKNVRGVVLALVNVRVFYK